MTRRIYGNDHVDSVKYVPFAATRSYFLLVLYAIRVSDGRISAQAPIVSAQGAHRSRTSHGAWRSKQETRRQELMVEDRQACATDSRAQ